MLKKLLSLTAAIMLLSLSAFASVSNPVVLLQASETPAPTWADGTSKIESITIGDNTHIADLEEWDGTAMSETLTGTGIEGNPYQIATAADLRKFADIVNTDGEISAWAVLTSDIDMGNQSGAGSGCDWQNIAIENYAGTFNGQGYTIYDYWHNSNSQGGGLFETVVGGTIKNLNMVNAKVKLRMTGTTADPSGTLCSFLQNGTIENVTVSGKVYTDGDSARIRKCGGIVGEADGTSVIKNCYSNVDIDLARGTAFESGAVTANTDNYGVGGILGYTTKSTANVTIENCGNSGDINAPINNRVGGILGHNRSTYVTNCTILNCYNTGNITGQAQVAGILGWSGTAGEFDTNVYNTGLIVARDTTTPYAAGIANRVNKKSATTNTTYVYSSGDVQVKASDDSADLFDGVIPAAMLFTKNSSSAADLASQRYYALDSTFTSGEGDEAVSAVKPVYWLTTGGKTPTTNPDAYRLPESDFALESVLSRLNSDTNNPAAFAADIGINGGKPVLGWQVNNLQLTGNSYEISAENSMTLSLAEPGYFQAEITSIAADNVEIVLTDALGNVIETKKAGKMGATAKITFNSGDATEVKLTTEGRAVITKSLLGQTAGNDMSQLTNNSSKVIKVTLSAEKLNAGDTGAIFVAHYLSDGGLRDIHYRAATVAPDGTISAKISLSDITIKPGDYIKAFLWDGAKLSPVLAAPQQLNN